MAHVAHIIRRNGPLARVFILAALGCGGANPQPTAAPPAAAEPAQPAAPASLPAAEVAAEPEPAKAAPATPIFSGCVLHAGDAEKRTVRVKRADGGLEPPVVTGKCWFNAECIQQQGRASPGDGNVELQCTGTTCVCEYEPLTPPGPATRVQFELEQACTSAKQAKILLRERCMAGMAFGQGT